MEFKKLYKVLVMGGAMATMGCGTTQNATEKSTATPKPNKDVRQPSAVKAPVRKVTLKGSAKAKAAGIDCKKVCHGEGSDMICPDPEIKAENCCWLMSVQHVCCE